MLPVQWVPLAGDTCSEFWGDFSITQPRIAHASHPGTLRCPFFRHDIFSGFSPLRWFKETGQVLCYAEGHGSVHRVLLPGPASTEAVRGIWGHIRIFWVTLGQR